MDEANQQPLRNKTGVLRNDGSEQAIIRIGRLLGGGIMTLDRVVREETQCIGIAAAPCEVFAATGLEIKARSPLKPTFLIELANGYNAFHEMVRFAIPALFVPMRRETDDQGARARYAASVGVALAVDGPQDERIEDRLGELLDADRRGAMRERLEELRPDNGAREAARWIEALAEPPGEGLTTHSVGNPPLGDGTQRRSSLRARAARAWVFVRTIPRTITRLMVFQHKDAEVLKGMD